VKDGINNAVVEGQKNAVNSEQGSKLAGHVRTVVPPGESFTVEVRFTPTALDAPFQDFDTVFTSRIAEADAFYSELHPASLGPDHQLVGRQAFAGLLWSKQYYHYDIWRWLKGDPTQPP